MKLKSLLLALSLIASTMAIGINSAQARKPTVEQLIRLRQIYKRYCTNQTLISRNERLARECYKLRVHYQRLLRQRQRNVQEEINQSIRNDIIEDLKDSNCLASSGGC